MATAPVPVANAMAMVSVGGGRSAIALPAVGLDDAGDDVALDELALLLGGLAEGSGGEAVEVAHRAGGGFVQEGRGVAREQLAVAAGVAEAEPEVLGGVVGNEGFDLEAVMKARVERAVATQREAVAELREADEHDREQRAAVPLVVEQDVEVVERVLVQEVGLVEEEDRMDALAGEFLDVGRDGVEEVAGGGCGRQPECVAAADSASRRRFAICRRRRRRYLTRPR